MEEPLNATERGLAREKVSLENLWWVRYNALGNYDNQQLLSEETAIREVLLYKRAGGGTLVEPTTMGIGRDPAGLARVSRATGVHIIMGAGYYTERTYPPGSNITERDEEDIAEEVVREIVEGIGDTGVRAGFIGEVGCTWPITPNERKVLRASIRAQRQTGAALMIHTGRDEQSPLEILEILQEADADLEHTIICHIERVVYDFNNLRKLAGAGIYLAYDDFGQEREFFRWKFEDVPNDAQRIDQIKHLRDEGFLDRIHISIGVSSKVRQVTYGGHGYSHILLNVVPRMRIKGLSEEEINTLLVENPKRAFRVDRER